MSENTQCATCSLSQEAKDFVTEAVAKKFGPTFISQQLKTQFDVGVSETSIRRHIKNHLKVDLTKSEADPKEKEEVVIDENGSGYIQTRSYDKPVNTDLISNVEEMMINAGVDPSGFDIVGDIGVSSWNSAAFDREKKDFVTVRLHSYRIKVQKKAVDRIDLPLLWAQAKRESTALPKAVTGTRRTAVTVFADLQAGKCGSRGDTKSLIGRVESIRAQYAEVLENSEAEAGVFQDAGDIVEGFENVAAQQFTNDLSIMDQLDLALTLEFDMMRTMADIMPTVDVMGVPSNHTGWRKGKDYLGKPSDDYGIYLLKQIKKIFDMSPDYKDRIQYHFPNEWEESLNLEVNGYGLGLVHGHQANQPEGVPKWWSGQSHGRQAVSESDILVTGHFHHFRAAPSGRNRYGKSRWWLQAPTLDNGSDWHRNRKGEESDPGLLYFEIAEDVGLDLSSLRIISAE